MTEEKRDLVGRDVLLTAMLEALMDRATHYDLVEVVLDCPNVYGETPTKIDSHSTKVWIYEEEKERMWN